MVSGDGAGEETYAEIDGNTYKVTKQEKLSQVFVLDSMFCTVHNVLCYFNSAGQVGLLQSAAFAQGEGGLKGIPVTGTLGGEENGETTNMLTITGEDGLVYQVSEYATLLNDSRTNYFLWFYSYCVGC